jgi:penicillin-binding protein 1A
MIRLVHLLRGVFRTASVGLFVAIVVSCVGAGIFLLSTLRGLPDVGRLKDFQHSHASEVFSDDGVKIGEFTSQRRYPVAFDSIPRHVKWAFVAAEDSNFFEHSGVDLMGILRAVVSNIIRGRYAQGGSTITQQVARSLLLETRKKEITRKIREMVLAWRMERELSKDDILRLYLNEIYLGHGAYGIGAAARNYFNKKVDGLSVAEAALLAGLPQRPTEWDPFRTPSQAKQRQLYVLKRMAEEKIITPEQAAEGAAQTLVLHRLDDMNSKQAPYFTEYVRIHLMEKYGADAVLGGGYKVHTTVRYDYQKKAEEALGSGLREVDKRMGWRGVVQHLENEEKRTQFLSVVHDRVLERVVSTHLLPADLDSSTRKLPYDLSFLKAKNCPYYGNTPLREGDIEKAVVLELLADKVTLQVGLTKAEMKLAGMNWVKINEKPIQSPSQILRENDVVEVKIEKIDRKSGFMTVLLEQEPEVQGAFLSFDLDTGFVRAMVGGTDFSRSQFNRALHAKRQVGSTFKPFIYAAAIEKGFSPASLVADSPIVFQSEGGLDPNAEIQQAEDWRPHNYTDKFEGDIPLRSALIRSLNIPTVKILNEIGVDYGIQFARSFGITAVLPRELTIALGSWSSSLEELMAGFSLFPRLGESRRLYFITKVIDQAGNVLEDLSSAGTRKITHQSPSPSPSTSPEAQALRVTPQTAYIITDLLKGVVREGTGTRAAIAGEPIAGKTGTSNDHRDAWFIGYSPKVMTGVWIGYDKDKVLDPGETGGRVAAPIWAEYMKAALKDYPHDDFEIPEGIVFAHIDRRTGRLVPPGAEGRVLVAFKPDGVPDASGTNLARISEPGVRTMTMENDPMKPKDPGGATSIVPGAGSSETDDYLRQGYDN